MFRIRIQPFERELVCAADETILGAALRAGLTVAFGCRTGGCSTCKMRLVEGDIDGRGGALALAPDERDAGWFLPCVSRPRTDCVVDAAREDQGLLASERPTAFQTELVHNIRETDDIHAVRLRLVEPSAIKFVAGQFINVAVPGSQATRTYSIASPPSQTSHIDLYVRRRPQGQFSSLLANELSPGARLRVLGPYGQLRIRLSHRPILMVASGAGLAPMLAMLRDLADKRSTRPVRLFFRARSQADLFAQDALAEIGRALPALDYIPVISPRLDALSRALVERLGSAHDHDAYLGGSPAAIESTLPVLLGLGVRRRNIHFDVFTPAIGSKEP